MIRSLKRQMFLCLALSLLSFSVFSQKLKYSFGDVDPLDLTMKEFVLDNTVGAIKLLSYAHTFFDNEARKMKFVVHERIKIFNTDGFPYGQLNVRFTEAVKIKKFKASVYNLNANGSIEETKVSNSDLIKEKLSEGTRSIKMAFPKVKEGSVIEYTYTISIPKNITILPWYFQDFIPVRHSEFLVEYPEFAGYEVMLQNEQYINYITKPGKGKQLFMAKNLPAMPIEDFVGDIDDFRCGVIHEIKVVKDYRSGGAYNRVYEDWSGLNADLILEDEFGKRLEQMRFLKKEVPSFRRDMIAEEKINLIRNRIMNQVSSAQKESLWLGASPKETWNKGLGEAQEINMLFVGLLREAGFEANPVIISTRDNGLVNLEHAFVKQFNYVLALVEVDGKEVLLDAVYKNYPMGKLPGRLINKRGLMITKGTPKWIDLNMNGEKEVAVYSAIIDFDEKMNLSGELTIVANGLTAHDSREKLRGMDAARRREYFQQVYPGLSISAVDLENVEYSTKPFKTIISFRKESEESYGQTAFLNPLIFQSMTETPFKDKERYSPVDFNVPVVQKWAYTINFPESMSVLELPKPQAVSLPKNGARFSYNVSADKNKLTALLNYSVNTTFYSAEDYPMLREFFDKMVAAQQAMYRIERN